MISNVIPEDLANKALLMGSFPDRKIVRPKGVFHTG